MCMPNPKENLENMLVFPLNEEKKKRKSFLNLLISSLKFIGLCPSDKKTRLSWICGKIFVGSLFGATLYSVMHEMFNSTYKKMFSKVLGIMSLSARVAFWGCVLMSSMKTSNSWKQLVGILGLEFSDQNGSKISHFLKLSWIYLIPSIYTALNSYLWSKARRGLYGRNIIIFVIKHAEEFVRCQIAAFMWETSSILQSKYMKLNKIVGNITPKTETAHSFSKTKFIEEIREIKYEYTFLFRAVSDINQIFARILLITLFISMLNVLLDIYYTMTLFRQHSTVMIDGLLLTLTTVVSRRKFVLNLFQ